MKLVRPGLRAVALVWENSETAFDLRYRSILIWVRVRRFQRLGCVDRVADFEIENRPKLFGMTDTPDAFERWARVTSKNASQARPNSSQFVSLTYAGRVPIASQFCRFASRTFCHIIAALKAALNGIVKGTKLYTMIDGVNRR